MEKQEPFAVFSDPVQAVKAANFLSNNSAAIYASVYYEGLQNNEAINLINEQNPKPKEKHHFGALKPHK